MKIIYYKHYRFREEKVLSLLTFNLVLFVFSTIYLLNCSTSLIKHFFIIFFNNNCRIFSLNIHHSRKYIFDCDDY